MTKGATRHRTRCWLSALESRDTFLKDIVRVCVYPLLAPFVSEMFQFSPRRRLFQDSEKNNYEARTRLTADSNYV